MQLSYIIIAKSSFLGDLRKGYFLTIFFILMVLIKERSEVGTAFGFRQGIRFGFALRKFGNLGGGIHQPAFFEPGVF